MCIYVFIALDSVRPGQASSQLRNDRGAALLPMTGLFEGRTAQNPHEQLP